jgi:uncharacterized protein (DUF58 family)
MPTVRAAGVFVLALVVYAYGSTSEVAWLFLLAYWLWAMLVAAALYAAWNGARRFRLSSGVGRRLVHPESPLDWLPAPVARAMPANSHFEGDGAHLSVTLRSRRGTRGPALVRGRVGARDFRFGAGAVGESGLTHQFALEQLARGVIRTEGVVLEAGDPLGLFRRRLLLGPSERAVVLPRFASLGAGDRPREFEAALAAPRAGSGNEILGVREYQRGDPLRRIHWRLSARRGELVVREFEPPGVRVLTLLLDPAPASRAAADQVARLAASEVWECLREGGRAALWAPGMEPSTPSEGRSLWALLEWLARYPDLPAADLAPPAAGDAVAITAGGGGELFDALTGLRRRGAAARAWVVGDAVQDEQPGIPTRRVGLEWPLAD